jgi:hypothetical protein
MRQLTIGGAAMLEARSEASIIACSRGCPGDIVAATTQAPAITTTGDDKNDRREEGRS